MTTDPHLASSRTESAAAPAPPPSVAGTRRLLRSRNDRMITGLAAGIARHFDVDPVTVRAAFVVLALANGLGVLLYVVGSVVVPSDDGTEVSEELRRRDFDGAGRIVAMAFGLVLISLGFGALLENVRGIDVDWVLVGSGALVAVGALMVVTLGRVGRGPLGAVGVILTLMLAPLSAANIVASGNAFGDRSEHPTEVSQLQRYQHAFGSMTIDLRNLTLPDGTTTVRAQSAFGSVQVLVPRDVAVEVVGDTTFGSIQALGQEASAGPVQRRADVRSSGYDTASKRLSLQLSSAFGSVEVIR